MSARYEFRCPNGHNTIRSYRPGAEIPDKIKCPKGNCREQALRLWANARR